jgi:hypothetical protein
MLPWIHSIRHVHHRSSHEYLRVVTVREQKHNVEKRSERNGIETVRFQP